MAGRSTQNRKLCQNIFDVHRFDLLNVLETLREAFYLPVDAEKIKDETEDTVTTAAPPLNPVATSVSLIPDDVPTPTLTPPAPRISTPSLRAKTATPPPSTPDTQRSATPQTHAITTHQRRFSTPRPSSLPPSSVKAIPIVHIQRNLIRMIKKEPTKYNESEIMKILSQVFRIDSHYTRMEQLGLVGTLAIVAKGMRKKRVADRLSQLRAGLLQS
ncbi:hypothetical protein K450DRAFT_245848 [Umbelopsis ramanniana AG]|uniref:Uncharacterized protein n=1 Tax=Umbelopsis ramanniana AG TaxID=1314678 RepID=A0AAD5HDJ6_UMBRA|nr:uncharacterized protein K450DRAFT_245848 [Umbelopsis ramanniana AG]KAI8578641.1 hypothetical protein K450DRAFT_245848 [Umbelopsis ramanniana AG]